MKTKKKYSQAFIEYAVLVGAVSLALAVLAGYVSGALNGRIEEIKTEMDR